MSDAPPLSLAEWIVLALVAEQPRHGFAIAALTAPTADIGLAWHVPRPIVYRSISRLVELDLVRVEGTEHGGRGPQRSVLTATPRGSVAVRRWLTQPVAHVRDGRSELLVKFALLARRGRGQLTLILRQRKVFDAIEAALTHQQDAAEGFHRVLATWRTETVRAAQRFLDTIQSELEQPGGTGKR